MQRVSDSHWTERKNMALLTQEDIESFESCTSEIEWNDKCDAIKLKYSGYPTNWYSEMIMSGRATRILGSFGKSAKIQVFPLKKGSFIDLIDEE